MRGMRTDLELLALGFQAVMVCRALTTSCNLLVTEYFARGPGSVMIRSRSRRRVKNRSDSRGGTM